MNTTLNKLNNSSDNLNILDTNSDNTKDNNISDNETKVHILEYIKLSKKERTSHINLNSECIPSILTRNSSLGKTGDYNTSSGGKEAALNLQEYLNLEGKYGAGSAVHTCHKCHNDSMMPMGFVCVNPEHLYFGTPKENCEDRSRESRRNTGKKISKAWQNLTEDEKLQRKKKLSKGIRKFYRETSEGINLRAKQSKTSTRNMITQLESGKHISQQLHKCEHCGKEMRGRIFFRWHGDNCKHNPANQPKNNSEDTQN